MTKSEFVFKLETPINVAIGGSISPIDELLLKAPSNKQRHESAKLKQGFFRAMKDMEAMAKDRVISESDAKTSDEITGENVLPVLLMSTSVDLGAYQENFRLLLLNDICTAGGVKLTAPLFDALSDSDTEKLMGEYVATFLLLSLPRENGKS